MRGSMEPVIELMERRIPFNSFLGLRVDQMGAGFARFSLPFRPEFIGDPVRPALHGGVISMIIDTCGGAAVWSLIEIEDRVSTVDLRVDYLRPGPAKDLVCEATVLRIGNRVGVADMKTFAADDLQTVIASGKGVYNIKRGEAARAASGSNH
jgi:uncharacterized protein (TIGR00369 family)